MYTPEFSGPIEGYTVNYLKRNQWKLASSMEYEDMLQEAHLLFLQLKGRYGVMDTPQHFMSIYKRALDNHVIDLSKKDSKLRSMVFESDLSYSIDGEQNESYFSSIIGDLENRGSISILVTQAPNEVRMVLSLFLNGNVDVLNDASESWKASGRNKDCGNAMLCKMLGVKEGTDLIGKVEEYFSE